LACVAAETASLVEFKPVGKSSHAGLSAHLVATMVWMGAEL